MKKLLLIIFVFATINAKAQADLNVLPLQNQKIVFTRSSDALDMPKSTVFARGQSWMVNSTAMGMAVQTADTASGIITGIGHFSLKLKGGGFSADDNRFDFRVQLSCYDNQYTLQIDNLTFIQIDANGSPTSSAIPLETEAKTSNANANAINMQLENIYFSLIDAMSNAAGVSVTGSNYTPAIPNQLYLNLIKTSSEHNSVDYDTPDKELIQLHKIVSDGYNSTSVIFSILRPVAEAVNRPVIITFDDASTDTLTAKSYWVKQGGKFLYTFTWNPIPDGMPLLLQKQIKKIQMAETTIIIDDVLSAKVKAWATYFNTLSPAGMSTQAATQLTLDALPEVDGKVFYQSNVDVPNKSKDFIFTVANKWMLDNFKNNKTNGILSEDKDQGQILGQGTFKIDYTKGLFAPENDYIYGFKIQIDCKDNKYRIQLYNTIYYGLSPDQASSLESYNEVLSIKKGKAAHQDVYKVDAQFKAVMQSLADAVNKAVKDDF